jgi:hypothetical protein
MGEICFSVFPHIVYDNENRREDMMFDGITILCQYGTEFRIGAYRGTQFRFPSTLQKSKFPILEVEAQREE